MSDFLTYEDSKILSIYNRQGHQELLVAYKDSERDCTFDRTDPHGMSVERISEGNRGQAVIHCNCGCGLITIHELRRNVLNDVNDSGCILHAKLDWAIEVYASQTYKNLSASKRRYFEKQYTKQEIENYLKKQKEHLETYGVLALETK